MSKTRDCIICGAYLTMDFVESQNIWKCFICNEEVPYEEDDNSFYYEEVSESDHRLRKYNENKRAKVIYDPYYK